MNYLGHIYFSQNNPALMYANLFGDFVKGKDLSSYAHYIQKGIRIHREIDHFIDHHPITIELFHHLYPSLPKVAGIAVDIYFDHLLAKNWSAFSSIPFNDFIADFYKFPIIHSDFPNQKFHAMITTMKKYNWILHYKELDGLDKACQGVSARISFENNLYEGLAVFLKNEERITIAFYAFMEKAIEHFAKFNP